MAVLRAATPSDIHDLADTFVSAVNYSIPGRQLGEEFYNLQADLALGESGVPPGKLWTRFQEQFSKEQIWLAEVDGKVAGYVAWYAPVWTEGSYKPGEVSRKIYAVKTEERL
ncbi:hypothetical protein B0H11DRAFT_2269783 [Mycena galericulata]|nr:hypothetical protein B0H11DRAFT_2269783 [Mycena galericulata]